jgi:RNA polymerase sigma-70 factor (ECF subfamily)
MTAALGANFFRHEYGRLVAMISRRVGLHRLESVEDAVQLALLAALEAWPRAAVPDNPSAWLYRVALNHFVGEERNRSRRDELLVQNAEPPTEATVPPPALLGGDVQDELLRMLFVCCDPDLPVESQIVLALKVLCGFEVREIAERLFTTEANVYKRLGRARTRLAEAAYDPDMTREQLAARLPAVRAVLYTLYTEGYLSSHADAAIRRELCDEATRLTEILAGHPAGAAPETFALLALMHLHTARMMERQDGSGGLLLLDEQDRSRWDQDLIHLGLSWLARAAEGNVFSRYHAEAGIAAEHCLARSLAETRWDRIVECYSLLDRLSPSPIHTLNRAIAIGEWRGPAQGLAELAGLKPPSWLEGSHLWSAVLADLHARCGHAELAGRYRDAALSAAPSSAIRRALERRLTNGKR